MRADRAVDADIPIRGRESMTFSVVATLERAITAESSNRCPRSQYSTAFSKFRPVIQKIGPGGFRSAGAAVRVAGGLDSRTHVDNLQIDNKVRANAKKLSGANSRWRLARDAEY
jgi:hypothetical protein